MNIARLKEEAGEQALIADFPAQLQSRVVKMTKGGKPYYDLVFADSTGPLSLKVWGETPLHEAAGKLAIGDAVRLEGEWTQNQYGINGSGVSWKGLTEEELLDFFAGERELREKQDADLANIRGFCGEISDYRLKALTDKFFVEMGERFRRTAAARKNHHARRGGLVEHVAQMMRGATAICGVYPQLNKDLMIAGVLFHDCGKLWENTYPQDGFAQQHSLHGEMLGHISLGIELVNKLWRELHSEAAFDEAGSGAEAEQVRLHLLHLIGSHHGQLEYGSPVLPKTPEAYALHYIDNLDAKLEMVAEGYRNGEQLAPGIYERNFPLPTGLVTPLPKFAEPER